MGLTGSDAPAADVLVPAMISVAAVRDQADSHHEPLGHRVP